ncbi:hypothetical protein [Corticicoccus populi]|uniref:Uncharacterized protein n=1 Tax=Corticicoccus populi TaxID=1812821 RepID=A0ABW5X159_9STAP
MKDLIIRIGLTIGLTAIITGSFLYDYAFMNGYLQYGPMITFIVVVIIMAGYEHFFQKDDKDSEDETTEEPPADFGYVVKTSLFLIYVILLASILKLIFGPPVSSVYDTGSMDFWIPFIILSIMMSYRVWRSGQSDDSGSQ